tara:strand:- start:577 stop:786 length:210 start_codon:yes stop_codon:yes gene_type:complete
VNVLEQGNRLILQAVELLNEVSPSDTPGVVEFTTHVIDNRARLLADAKTIVTVASDLEARLIHHEGTIH